LATLPEFDWDGYKKLIAKFNFNGLHLLFLDLLKKTTSVKELNLNEQKFARIKKEILGKI